MQDKIYIDELLTKKGFVKINKFCQESLKNVSEYTFEQIHYCDECPPLKEIAFFYKQDFLKIDYETKDKIINICNSDFDKMDFFYIPLSFFDEFSADDTRNKMTHIIYNKKQLDNYYYPYNSGVIVGIEYENNKKPKYFISITKNVKYYFDTEKEGFLFQEKTKKWISEILYFLKPKTFSNYKYKIFKFKKIRQEYSSFDINNGKIFLGNKIEKDLELSIKEGYDKENFENSENFIHNNWITYEKYETIVKKIKKYGGKKVVWKDLKIEDFLFDNLSQYANEIFKLNKKAYFANQNIFTENGNYSDDDLLLNKKIVYQWPIKDVEKAFFDAIEPTNLRDCDNYNIYKLLLPFMYKSRKDVEIYVLDDKKYGIDKNLFKKIEYKNLCYPISHQWFQRLTKQNFILINKKNPKAIKYGIHISDFYEYFYVGKYFPLKMKYFRKIAELEKDIFLRNGKDIGKGINQPPGYDIGDLLRSIGINVED